MIVDSMTHEEVYKELERDRENFSRWLNYAVEKQRRRIIKSVTMPVKFWMEYLSPRKVRYMVYVRAYEKHKISYYVSDYALHRRADGFALYVTWPIYPKHSIKPMVYLPHVFTQYALPERGNVQKTVIDLIKHFISRNTIGVDSHNQDVVGRSVRYNGQHHISCCVSEGVLLGHMVGEVYEAHTFITYEQSKGLQQEEFGKCLAILPDERSRCDAM